MEKTKIVDLLTHLCLQQLYEGEQSGILLILGKKQISDKYIRLRVQDARHQDNAVCDVKEVLDEVQVGTSDGSLDVSALTHQTEGEP